MKTKRWTIKQLCLLLSIVLIATVTAGGSLAYIFTKTDDVTNTFTPTEVTCFINETMENNVKKNVSVTNTGDTDAYIRVAIVATWQNGNGQVAAQAAIENNDYEIDLNTGDVDDKWKKSGDYWYYTVPVASGGVTDVLINSCRPVVAGPDGYTLHVEIIADAIQASPVDAVIEAWGVNPSAL